MKTVPDIQADDATRAEAMKLWEKGTEEFGKIFNHYTVSQVVAPDLHPLMLDEDMAGYLDKVNSDTIIVLFLVAMHTLYGATYEKMLADGTISTIRRDFANVQVNVVDDAPEAS